MQNSCTKCQSEFEVTAEDQEFYGKVSPVFNGKKFPVSPPTLCPDCRQQRRLTFNNEMTLYQRKCDLSGEQILSIFSPDKPYKVYKGKNWWSDKWDSMDYGRPYNFEKQFFEQFKELYSEVPQVALQTNFLLDENSDYTNYAGSNKDCYMIFHADYNRDCYYGYGVKKCESSSDVFNLFDSELCYQSIDCQKCYNLSYSQDCINCTDSYFLQDCSGCKNCFGCKNLHQKEYHIFNEPYTKEEYEKYIKDLELTSDTSISTIKEKVKEFYKKHPYKSLHMRNTEDSFGDHLINCRNVTYSYDVADMRDGKYCFQLYNGAKDCMDLTQFGLKAELVYEGSCIGYNSTSICFCHICNEQISDLFYCINSHHSSNLFGCVGLGHKKYCILNKQYTKEEYEELVPKIIEHMRSTKEWGEFFPSSMSPFCYNETTANQYYPLTKEHALEKGYKWKEKDKKEYQEQKYEVPDDIEDVPDSIINKILACEDCGKNYKIIQQELEMYRKRGNPIPLKCPDCRHKERMDARNPRKLFERKCDKCSTEIKTTYKEGRPETVYCEKCYLAAMY